MFSRPALRHQNSLDRKNSRATIMNLFGDGPQSKVSPEISMMRLGTFEKENKDQAEKMRENKKGDEKQGQMQDSISTQNTLAPGTKSIYIYVLYIYVYI